MHRAIRRYLATTLTAPILFGAVPALAQASGGTEDGSDLRSTIEALEAREKAALDRIESLERRLEMFEQLLGVDGEARVSDSAQGQMRGRGAGLLFAQGSVDGVAPLADAAAQDASGEIAAAATDRKTPAPTEAVEAVSEREQGFLGDRLSFELGVNYAHFDDARVNLSGFLALDAIFLGLISIDETRADVVTADAAVRYGINDRFQIDVDVPYLYRHAYFQSGGAGGNATALVSATTSDHGLGDISVGASYRLFRETFDRPDVVANVRVKAPTGRHPFGIELVEVAGSEGNLEIPEALSFGTGVWSTSAGVSVLKTLDPMVVFGSLTYFHNWEESFADIEETTGDQPGSVRLGNAFQYGAGIAFALNERSSLSTSFTQRFVQRTKLRPLGEEWQPVVGSQANVALMNFGATFSLARNISLLATVSMGLTADAPDMIASLRVPIRF